MKRFLKLFLIVTFAFAISFGLASCGGDTVSKEEFDAKVKELQDALADKEALQEQLDQLSDLPNKFGVATVVNDKLTVVTQLAMERSQQVTLEAVFAEGTTMGVVSDAVEWSTDADDDAFTVVDGVATAYAAGTFNVTATFKFQTNIKKTIPVTVTDPTFVDDTGKTKIVVGTPKMNGLFLSGFGNSTYDVNIRNLIYGYSTIWTTPGEEFIWDTRAVLVGEPTTQLLEPRTIGEGEDAYEVQDKAFTFELQKDLKWNDGTTIKAKDYLFSLLFAASKQWADQGATTSVGDKLLGYADYRAKDATIPEGGSTPVFKGALLDPEDEYKFTLIVDGKNLPYFYENTMVAVNPYPMHVWAPEANVVSTPEGSYLTGFTTDHAKWVKDVYLKNPTVTCGPYNFIFFKNQVVRLEKNTLFKTDGEGYKPQIDVIEQKWINQDTDVYQLLAGEVDIVAGIIEGEKIEALKASSTAYPVTYDRNGYGMMAFHCDFGPTKEQKVRQALGMLVDRNEFVQEILGGYGKIVHAAYGTAQWMYQEKKDTLEDQLIKYSYNPDKANEFLDESSYKYEADGVTPFDKTKAGPGTNYWRHNAQGEMLQINHLGTVENDITDLIQLRFPENCTYAGIKFTVTTGDFDMLLDNYYDAYKKPASEREFHSFNLATGFGSPYDPYYSWHSVWVGNSYYNSNQLADELFDEYTEGMQKLSSDQKDEFANLWLAFQLRWNELLPSIPLYSNTYFDGVSNKIENFQTTPTFYWSYAIVQANLKGQPAQNPGE